MWRVESSAVMLLIFAAYLVNSGCAAPRYYRGVEATDLAELKTGISRSCAEKVVGVPINELQCDGGAIVTYVYDRGWTGCVGERRCDPENENGALAWEIGANLFSFGMATAALNMCITPCQKGYLELFFDYQAGLIGVRELPTARDEYCWDPFSKFLEQCGRVYLHRRPRTVDESLILKIPEEDDSDRICNQFVR